MTFGAALGALPFRRLTKLPRYFKGREGGPAELAMVAEHGPELIGRPGSFRLASEQAVTRLEAGDRVFTAPHTRQMLRDHDLVQGRLVARQERMSYEADLKVLRPQGQGSSQAREAEAQLRAEQARLDTDRIVKALQELPLYKIEEDGIFRYTQKQQSVTKTRASRYMKDQ